MTQTFNVGGRSRFVTITAWVFIVLGLTWGTGGAARYTRRGPATWQAASAFWPLPAWIAGQPQETRC